MLKINFCSELLYMFSTKSLNDFSTFRIVLNSRRPFWTLLCDTGDNRTVLFNGITTDYLDLSLY